MQTIGAFSNVEIFDASTKLPTLSFLQQFDAALVWSSDGQAFPLAAGLGDVLAQYWDSGGSVILTADAICLGKLTGRFASPGAGYMLIDGLASIDTADDSLGTIYEPDSPLLADVSSLSAWQIPHSTGSVINSGTTVAAWAKSWPLVVRGIKNGRPLVVLNMHPGSKLAGFGSGWWGDGAKLMRNAVLFSVCAPCGDKYSSAGKSMERA